MTRENWNFLPLHLVHGFVGMEFHLKRLFDTFSGFVGFVGWDRSQEIETMNASTMDGRVNRTCSHTSEIPAIFVRMKCKSQFLARTGGLSLLSAHDVLLFNCLIIIALSRKAYEYVACTARTYLYFGPSYARSHWFVSFSAPKRDISPNSYALQLLCFRWTFLFPRAHDEFSLSNTDIVYAIR